MSPDHPAHEANRVAKAIRFAQVIETFVAWEGSDPDAAVAQVEAMPEAEWRQLARRMGETMPSEACRGAVIGLLRSKALAPISTDDLFKRLGGA